MIVLAQLQRYLYICSITNQKTDIMNYAELENKITNNEYSRFVVRDTYHPAEDLERNWSSFLGGIGYCGEGPFSSEEEAIERELERTGKDEPEHEYRYHPAHEGYCIVDYDGLGAFRLESETVEEAIKEADEYSEKNDLAITLGDGDGHIFAEQVISIHEVREGRYIFEVI